MEIDINFYIERKKFELFGGTINQEILFTNGLNIISGENGTGKTRLLTSLKTDSFLASNSQGFTNANQVKIIAFSPKRNSVRKTVENAFTEFRQQNRRYENIINEYVNRAIQDINFENYPPFGELFAGYFDYLDRKGGDRKKVVTKIKNEFNSVLKRILLNYEIEAVWDESNGYPTVYIKKNGVSITLSDLSLGEQEILSLIFNLYMSRNESDIFLIDEPEVHLNWSLEMTLFNFLNDFCLRYKKQIIVVTHSRVIFTKKYYSKSQFLVWENGSIVCKKEIDDILKGKLAGEAVSLTQVVKLSKKTFFVEDLTHKEVVKKVAEALNKDVDVIECDNKTNVLSLLKMVGSKPEYKLAYFLIDGDNEGNPFPKEDKLIYLSKYCMECYLMDLKTLAKTFNDTEANIKSAILKIIQSNKKDILKHYNFLDFVIGQLKESDITDNLLTNFDCSKILFPLLKKYKLQFHDFLEQYVNELNVSNKLQTIFEKKLIEKIQS